METEPFPALIKTRNAGVTHSPQRLTRASCILGVVSAILLVAGGVAAGRGAAMPWGNVSDRLAAAGGLLFGLSSLAGVPAVITGIITLSRREGNKVAAITGIATGGAVWAVWLVPVFTAVIGGAVGLLRSL